MKRKRKQMDGSKVLYKHFTTHVEEQYEAEVAVPCNKEWDASSLYITLDWEIKLSRKIRPELHEWILSFLGKFPVPLVGLLFDYMEHLGSFSIWLHWHRTNKENSGYDRNHIQISVRGGDSFFCMMTHESYGDELYFKCRGQELSVTLFELEQMSKKNHNDMIEMFVTLQKFFCQEKWVEFAINYSHEKRSKMKLV